MERIKLWQNRGVTRIIAELDSADSDVIRPELDRWAGIVERLGRYILSEQRKQESGNWAARAAYWAKTAPESVSITDDLNQLLIELTEIRPGDHVLDLASGTGEPAISIALRVGGAGSVTALDAYPEMLAGRSEGRLK